MACGRLAIPWQSRIFGFSKHTVYDGIKFARAQPVHKVKADRDERSGEPAGNVRLKGCLVCVEAVRAAVGADRAIALFCSPTLAGHKERRRESERGGEGKPRAEEKEESFIWHSSTACPLKR